LPEKELMKLPIVEQVFEPAEVEVDEFNNGDGEPEDGVLPEEGCGGAPEGSHLGWVVSWIKAK
jgi:hypothetical protein